MDQHFNDMQESNFKEPSEFVSEHSSPTASNVNGNVDRVLFKNLVEMVPLVESLMDRRTNSSFTRRASLVYTKTPSRDSNLKKMAEPKGRKTAQIISTKKKREPGDNDLNKNINRENQDGVADEFSLFSPSTLAVKKDREELVRLREQVEVLERKLLEKDERLKSAENTIKQQDLVQATVNELKRQLEEKDALIRSAHLQLSNAKIKLADKQAVLEKKEWEAKTSNQKAERLQGELDSLNDELTRFMHLFQTSLKNYSTPYVEEDDATSDDPLCDLQIQHYLDQASHMESIDETEMQCVEEMRKAYLAALSAAKANPSEESMAITAEFRLQLQAYLVRPILGGEMQSFHAQAVAR